MQALETIGFFKRHRAKKKEEEKKQQQTTPGISEQRWWDAQIERGSLGEKSGV